MGDFEILSKYKFKSVLLYFCDTNFCEVLPIFDLYKYQDNLSYSGFHNISNLFVTRSWYESHAYVHVKGEQVVFFSLKWVKNQERFHHHNNDTLICYSRKSNKSVDEGHQIL